MRIHILKATVCGGKPVAPGQELEASSKDANYLIATGAAEPADDTKPKPKKKITKMVDTDELETRAE